MPFFRSLGLAILVIASVAVQTQGRSDVPQLRPEQTPGYKPIAIQGFTVMVSHETWGHKDDAVYERKPLDVLEWELKKIIEVMPANAIAVLRNIGVWVDWDKNIQMGNGRKGKAVAMYFGGHQRYLLANDMNPLQARNVTILNMKMLTEEHQPKRDAGRCVILHEIAHAVHDQLVGRQNPNVKWAYKQALDRKLLDPTAYASTNENEFFAEMKCAYFDQLQYHPRNRSDLKKHDPVTFKLMEGIWGKTKKALAKTAPGSGDVEAPPLEQLDLGKWVSGPTVSHSLLIDRPCFIIYWNGSNPSSLLSLSKIRPWNAELSDFGLITVAVHLTGARPIAVKQLADSRSLNFAVTEGKWTPKTLVKEFKDFPVALVYGHDGECTFRGNPFDAESALRMAVGAAQLADLEIDKTPKALGSVVEAITKGRPLALQFAFITSQTKAKDEETAKFAEKLLYKMTEEGRRALEAAESSLETDPLKAFLMLERLPRAFRDSPVESKARAMLAKVKQNKEVATELTARKALSAVLKIQSYLESQSGSYDPTQEKFRATHAQALTQLRFAVTQMKQTWPITPATEQALGIAAKLGMAVP